MRKYEPEIGRTVALPIVIGVIVTAAIVTGVMFLPTNGSNTPPTPLASRNIGILAANYLNSRRDDVVFYWIYNSTFVNNDLSAFYQQTNPSAYVDGVYMIREIETPLIKLLFAPWQANLTGSSSISVDVWQLLSGDLIDEGIRQMPDAESHPDSIWDYGVPTLNLEVCFNDGTLFHLAFAQGPGLVEIRNGTWSSGYTEFGWPEITGYSFETYWLQENGYLSEFMTNLYNTIVENVVYPVP